MKRYSILAMALLIGACSTSPNSSEQPASISAARAQWTADASDDYQFDFQRECFCVREAVQPVRIEVRDGEVVSVVSRETGEPVAAAAPIEWYTIEELFGIAEDAEAEGQEVEVEYGPGGYPSEITIGSLAADAGMVFHVSDVRPL